MYILIGGDRMIKLVFRDNKEGFRYRRFILVVWVKEKGLGVLKINIFMVFIIIFREDLLYVFICILYLVNNVYIF